MEILFVTLSGLAFGSFIGCCTYRIPLGISLLLPRRSFCPACGHTLCWWENIPLLSFLLLKGSCSHCQQQISAHYSIIEMLMGLLTLIIYWAEPGWPEKVFFLLFFYGLLAIAVIDLQHLIVPNRILIIMLAGGILMNALGSVFPWPTVWGGFFAGLVSMLILSYLGARIVGREALGMGDVKLIAVSGFFLGWQLAWLGLFFAASIALIVTLILRNDRKSKIPFAPFIGIGCFLAYLGGDFLRQFL